VKDRNLVARLRDIHFCLLAPADGSGGADHQRVSLAHSEGWDHWQLSLGAHRLRSLFKNLTASREPVAVDFDPRDGPCWQIVALADGAVVGAVRLRVYRSPHVVAAEELFSFCDMSIVDSTIRRNISDAFEAYAKQHLSAFGRFFLVGGLAVSRERQRTGLGPVLGLAVNAFLENMGIHGGCLAGPEKMGPLELYQRMGGSPLALHGVELPPFPCANHGHLSRVLAIRTFRYETHLADTIATLRDWMTETPAIVPVVREEIAC
jgi:hypothetical protein